MFRRRSSPFMAAVILLALATSRAEAAATWSLLVDSAPGAWVGGGQKHLYINQTDPLSLLAGGLSPTGPTAILLVHSPSPQAPDFSMYIADSNPFVVSEYLGATRSSGPPYPDFDFTFAGAGNNEVFGWFEILAIEYHYVGPSGGGHAFILDKLAMTFAFRGGPTQPEVTGAFALNTTLPASIPEPNSMALVVVGLTGIAFFCRRRSRQL